VENARQRFQEMIQETETYRRAQRRAGETLDRAERYSEQVSRGSEAYREQVMAQLERWFGESLESVAESRQELEVTPGDTNDSNGSGDSSDPRDQGHLDETQPQERQEQVAGESEDDGRGWRASSA